MWKSSFETKKNTFCGRKEKWLIHHYPWPNTKWSVLRCMRVWEGNHHSPYQFNRFITFFMNNVLISFETHYNIILSLWLFSHFATLISIISVLKIELAQPKKLLSLYISPFCQRLSFTYSTVPFTTFFSFIHCLFPPFSSFVNADHCADNYVLVFGEKKMNKKK